MAYYVPTVAGLTLLTGLNGQISLGHGALMAVGAYTTALLLERARRPCRSSSSWLASVTVTGAGRRRRRRGRLPAARALPRRRHAGARGRPARPRAVLPTRPWAASRACACRRPTRPAGSRTSSSSSPATTWHRHKYVAYLGWALALVVLLLLSNLLRSRYGRVWRAVRDDEVAAELAGINLGRARVLAFVVSAVCGRRWPARCSPSSPGSRRRRASRSCCRSSCSSRSSSAGSAACSAPCSAARCWSSSSPSSPNVGLDAGLIVAQAANIAPLVFGIVLIVVMLAAPQGVVGTIRHASYLTRKAGRTSRAATAEPRASDDCDAGHSPLTMARHVRHRRVAASR